MYHRQNNRTAHTSSTLHHGRSMYWLVLIRSPFAFTLRSASLDGRCHHTLRVFSQATAYCESLRHHAEYILNVSMAFENRWTKLNKWLSRAVGIGSVGTAYFSNDLRVLQQVRTNSVLFEHLIKPIHVGIFLKILIACLCFSKQYFITDKSRFQFGKWANHFAKKKNLRIR